MAPSSVLRPRGPTLLDDLPFYLAGLDLAFRGLLERLRTETPTSMDFRPGMGSIFFALCEQDDCIIKDLVRRLKLPNSTVTGLLDAMEQGGVVERHDCPDDGRAYRVRLTVRGRALEPEMRRWHNRAVQTLQHGLSPGEVRELKRLLGRVLSNLHAHEDQWRVARRRDRVAALLARQTAPRSNGTKSHARH